ncbi:MAG: TetR/AcrR family transcriptional regulator C-terminal domain-containing protein [Candidatus Devosia euplotis]|nr:TetR/AcrR family transcriptional regulator C-terminal domain-containing protein [Candidatus Devosia euplotis]
MALDRHIIVAAALDLLDQHGLDGFSMRRLAVALGVQAPSIYWHYPDKTTLFDDMADALLQGIASEPDEAVDYATILRRTAGQLRDALHRRRDGALVYAGTFVVRDNVLRLAEAVIGAMTRAGYDSQTASRTVFTMLYYVLGFVIEEQALARHGGLGAPEIARRLAVMADDSYPAVRAALPHISDPDHDARFESGVELLIRGLSQPGAGNEEQIRQLVKKTMRASR